MGLLLASQPSTPTYMPRRRPVSCIELKSIGQGLVPVPQIQPWKKMCCPTSSAAAMSAPPGPHTPFVLARVSSGCPVTLSKALAARLPARIQMVS